ncbi:MAG: UbiA family prenyltransferase [Bacteroidales bacterium]|nr:UbiA family prenyltransferase [Bacteroidales bacterium]
MTNHFRKISQIFRTKDWLFTKFLFNIAVISVISITFNIDFKHVLYIISVFCIYLFSVGSLGYFINDYFDIETDLLAGKKNFCSKLTNYQIVAIILGLFTIAIILAVIIPTNKIAYLIMVGIQISLFILYSAHKTRFKTNILGVFSDSLFSFVIPALISVCFIDAFHKIAISFYLTCGFVLWLFLIGLRSILSHQKIDFENDITSGVKTFAQSIGKNPTKILINVIIIFELGILITIVALFFNQLINSLFLSLAVYLVFEIILNLIIYKNKYNTVNELISVFYKYYILIGVLFYLAANNSTYFYLALIGLVSLIYLNIIIVRIKIIFGFIYHKIAKWIWYKFKGALRRNGVSI